MCGRFVSSSSPGPDRRVLRRRVERRVARPELQRGADQRHLRRGRRHPTAALELQVFHWGLIPVWAKDRKIGQKMINARSETLAEKAAFKSRLQEAPAASSRSTASTSGRRRRGRAGDEGRQAAKQPHFIHRVDGEPLAVAGLWAAWRDRDRGPGRAVAAQLHDHHDDAPTSTMAAIHDRMPVILPRGVWHVARPDEPRHRRAVEAARAGARRRC